MSGSNHIKEAANTPPEAHCTPLEAILENCTEQFVQEYKFLSDKDIRTVELVRESIIRGIELANSRVGDLF